MADFSKLNDAVSALSEKVDLLIAKQPEPPVDDQPAIDAVTAAVEAITGKIPA